MIRKEIDKGIMYLCVHKLMEQRVNNGRIISKKDFFRMLGETFHIPKKMRIVVMKEMIDKSLVEDLGTRRNNNLKVMRVNVCIENDTNKVYRTVGIC